MKSLLNLRCHVYFDPTTEKNIRNTHTHKPRIGQSISIDAPTLLFNAKSTSTAQTYPSVTLAAAYPKPKKVHYKIKLLRSNATRPTSRNLCPSPMATTYCHRSSQDHTRPGFLAPVHLFCANQNRDFLDYHRLLLLTDVRPCPCS